MPFSFASKGAGSRPVFVLEPDDVALWTAQQSDDIRAWVEAHAFSGALGSVLMVPGEGGAPGSALIGYGTEGNRRRGRFALAAATPKLAPGTYHIASGVPEDRMAEECLGWLLSAYGYSRYRDNAPKVPDLVAPDGIDTARIETLARAEALTRDLVNTPASDMGPPALEAAARTLATQFDADITVTLGDDLVSANFPMIHAVGRASADEPRLIDMRWGTSGPTLTLVGKGVCFDTGGLNLKPGSSMGLMKKDMGGAANVLGLAYMIMALDVRVRLRVLIPAVENAVSASSFRPQDILTSRKGLTVEINNTDAEGRLVLADALALADEEMPDLLISMATLTGAARVAMGAEVAPFFTDDDLFATEVEQAGRRMSDPVWRMPFWEGYEPQIEPGIADLDNAPAGGMGGAITAALFLRRFVEATPRYVHFDIYAWQPSSAPARPKGGVAQGPRAILDALPFVLDL